MAATKKAPIDPDDAPLKRLGGGRWQTRDERFTIEPQSGTWVVVDGDQTDDLGLPLVRGPFPSLTAAKDAISTARTSEPAASPLAARLEQRRREPKDDANGKAAGKATTKKGEPKATDDRPTAKAKKGSATTGSSRTEADEPREPGWLTDLGPGPRGRARRLIERLTAEGVADAEAVVRRDVIGDVPAIAALAVARRLAELGADASPDQVADLLADGRDDAFDVRWRLVDGEGRPILLERHRRGRS
jgi:hypothetical protein